MHLIQAGVFTAVLSDYEMSSDAASVTMTLDRSAMGTLVYVAPECKPPLNEPQNADSDMYV